jgi:phosphoribulokinase
MQRQRPILLGIVGDSAAGKSTITRGLVNILGQDRVSHICTDDYHRYDRRERASRGITALHPDCNYVDVLEMHLERLHYGQPILKPVYDHSHGVLVRPEYVRPSEFVVVEGLLGFLTPVMRQFYDVKVYLDPPEELRRIWKIKRDTTRRGYQPEEVVAELAKREPDSRDYIRPQRRHADMVVRFVPSSRESIEDPDVSLDVQLVLRPTIPHPDLTYLIDEQHGDGIRLELARDDARPVDFLAIDGHVTAGQAERLSDAIWQHLPDLRPVDEAMFGDYVDRTEVRHSHPLALTQLLLTYHLLRKYRDVTELPFAPPVSALSRVQPATLAHRNRQPV